MNKKKIIFIISIIVLFLIVISVILISKNKAKLDYKIEVVNEINYMLYSENNKFGVIDKSGNIVVQSQYDEVQIPNPSKPIFICMYNYNEEKNQYTVKVLNDKSEQILYQYLYVEAIKLNAGISEIPYEKSVLKFMQNGKYGLINFNGDIIIKPKYDEIKSLDYREGLLVVKKDDKYGIININGATVVKEKYDFIESDRYYDNDAEYKKSGFIVGNKIGEEYKYGYLNAQGKKILDNIYDQIERIENKDDIYIVAFKDEKAGLYKGKNNVIKHEYEDIQYDKNNNCLIIQQDSKQGISDLNGNILFELKYDNIYISGKYINAQNATDVEIFDFNTKQKIELDNIIGLNQTDNDKYLVAITNDEKYKIYNTENNQIMKNEYDYLEYIYDDYFIVMNNKKYGIIDINEEKLIDIKFDYIQKIENTKLIQAIDNSKKTTNIYIQDKLIASMNNGVVCIKDDHIVLQSNSDIKYISYDGKLVNSTDLFEKNIYVFCKNNKWGFEDKDHKVIVNAEYDLVTELNKYGFAGIKKDGKWGVINSEGNIILEPTYEIDSNNPNFIGKFYEYDLGYGEPYFISDNK